MNYWNIVKNDILNGEGFRVSLFVCGCQFRCPHCQNKALWSPYVGQPFTLKTKEELFNELRKPYCDGISILGGEPLHENNVNEVTKLAKEIRELFPYKTIWMWTGNNFDDVKDLEVMKYLDVLIDGLFILKEKDLNLKWRGSRNQTVIDVQASLKQGKKVLYCE